MKNFLFLALVAAFGMLLSADHAIAFGGPDGGPDGKPQTNSELSIQNTTAEDIYVWIRPAGTPVPATSGALVAMLDKVPARDTIDIDLDNGNYEISTFDDNAVNFVRINPGPITENEVNSEALARETLSLTEDRLIRVNLTDILFPRTGNN